MGTATVKVTRKAKKKDGNTKGTIKSTTRINVSYPKATVAKTRTINVGNLSSS